MCKKLFAQASKKDANCPIKVFPKCHSPPDERKIKCVKGRARHEWEVINSYGYRRLRAQCVRCGKMANFELEVAHIDVYVDVRRHEIVLACSKCDRPVAPIKPRNSNAKLDIKPAA